MFYICRPKLKTKKEMTKAELVNTISSKLGTEKNETQRIIEAFMQEIRTSMYNGNNVYLRGFGSFIIKTRAAKTGRNISKNTAIEIPAHNIPAFKPSKSFVEKVKTKVAVK
ncbi:Bacterial nucleoid DNA-binding protein [Bergeyella porcorum]|uniref:Bacterial nucleoid DNA-binding protein n=2 Tax=Bergeyella porcorum TaxID=1735111 RepID=A0AAU0EYU2_9FLAO